MARTRREERLAADQRLTQALQNQQRRLQQHHQQQLQEQVQRQLQRQQSAVRREGSHLQLSLSESADSQALQQKLHEAVARCVAKPILDAISCNNIVIVSGHAVLILELCSTCCHSHYGWSGATAEV